MKTTTHAPSRRTGFTLVELLVVIGIIATLIGLLMPSLGRAREQSRSVACASNMRQLYMAYASYANDNKGGLPSAYTDSYPGWVIHDGSGVNSLQDGTLWKYLRTAPVYRCPADPREEKTYLWSYAIVDPAGGDMGGGKWRKITNLRPSVQQAVFVEDADTRGWVWNSWMMTPNPSPAFADIPGAFHKAGRFGGMNTAFADGHVEFHQWVDARTPQYRLGMPNQPDNKDMVWLASIYLAQR